MALEMLESMLQETDNPDRRIYGVAVGKVIDNTDAMSMGRVQVQLPWLPDIQPWARVAVPMAGQNRGTYFIPQVDDEVLVAFHHGDIREPFVIGSLWNGQDQPPATDLTDPVTKRLIRSPQGLLLEFDDSKMTVTITIKTEAKAGAGAASASGVPAGGADQDPVPSVVLDPKGMTLKRAKGDNEEEQIVTINKDGITLKAKKGDIILKAEEGKLKIEAQGVEIKSKANIEVEASSDCSVKGHPIRLN